MKSPPTSLVGCRLIEFAVWIVIVQTVLFQTVQRA